MGNRTRWGYPESVIALKEFILTSENAIKGNDQKVVEFEISVHQCFEQVIRDAELNKQDGNNGPMKELRSQGEIISRLKKVRKVCFVFEGVVRKVNALQPNGEPTEEDIMNATTAVYNNCGNLKVI